MIILTFDRKFLPNGIVAGVSLLNEKDRVPSLKEIADFFEFSDFFYASQIHSGKTIVFGNSAKGEEGDAVLCFEKNVLLGIFTADCVPVYVFSESFCGIIHAGWRGFVNGIFESFFEELNNKKVNLFEVKAVIGACICGDCYEVGKEVAEKFPEEFVKKQGDRFFLDLKGCAFDRLVSAGLEEKNIQKTPYCTFHENWFHSYRRNRTDFRNVNFIGLKG